VGAIKMGERKKGNKILLGNHKTEEFAVPTNLDFGRCRE
jgi:hypothetical protein